MTRIALTIVCATGIALCMCAAGWLPRGSSRADDMTSTLLIGGSRLDVVIESGDFKLTQAEILHWVQLAGEAVATYYGRYPVPHVTIRIRPFDGSGVRHGQTFPYEGGLIKIGLGTETQTADLADDWMLTHEMVHLSFPCVPDENHWMEEGLATYVEPIARIQANQMTASRMWADLARDMPKGVPSPDEKGLDHTHTWASTYWGGALFCFLADVDIRKQTHNQKGLQDALRAILNAGGDINHDWDLSQTLKVGDRATGTTALTDLYAKMKDNPMHVDLAALWKQLGVERDGRMVRLLDDAPMAAIRRSITSLDTHTPGNPAASLPATAVYAGRTASRR